MRLGVLALVVVVLAGLAGCGGDRSPTPTAPAQAGSAPEQMAEATPTQAPAATATSASADAPAKVAAEVPDTNMADALQPQPPTGVYEDMPVGFTVGGHAYRGSPDAQIVLIEFSEFQCPYCRRHEMNTAPQIKDAYLKTGKVLHIFRNFPLEQIHPQARKASEAARCAGEQGADRFWAMHDRLFETQSEWSEQATAVDLFKGYAQALGLDADAFNECLDSGRASAAIDADLIAGEKAGVGGTPTFFLNGYPIEGAQPFSAFQQVLDAQLAGNPPPTPAPQQAGLPYWATEEGMSPDPERPGYTRAGDSYYGDGNASIVLIEFSDFQCPYCRLHAVETEPQLKKEYGDTGQVRFIFKHFPLPSHQHAERASVAAECAGRQEKFWPMYESLFATQNEWAAVSDAQPIFDRLAGEVGLDLAAYQQCLSDPAILADVLKDRDEGQAVGIRGTPSLVILKGGRGQLIPGALPYDQFKQVLDSVIATP